MPSPPDLSYGADWLVSYFITPQAFELRLFGRLTIYRVRKERIIGAHISTEFRGFLKRLFGAWELRGHPWNTFNMGSPFRRRYVLIEKRGWMRFLAITPDDPDRFVKSLGLPQGAPSVRN
jgi:hypothetical protein